MFICSTTQNLSRYFLLAQKFMLQETPRCLIHLSKRFCFEFQLAGPVYGCKLEDILETINLKYRGDPKSSIYFLWIFIQKNNKARVNALLQRLMRSVRLHLKN